MKAIRFVVLAALLAAFGSPAHAAEQTLEGTLVCAKCYLKKADAHECQDVLLVPGGNTANMLAVWRAHGFDRIVREAWEQGVVL